MTIALAQATDGLSSTGHRERAITRCLHRGFFTMLGLLPRPLAGSARTAYFNARFTDGSPWPYDTCSYEAAKRHALVAAVEPDDRVILEVGTANGHNLRDIAERAPTATVVGLDVSEQACDLARRRHADRPRIVVEHGDLPRASASLPWLHGAVDTLILAEVLYYFGGLRATTAQLAPVRDLLSPQGRIILLHGSPDAPRLHARAAACLGWDIRGEHHRFDVGRSFLLTVLERHEARKAG